MSNILPNGTGIVSLNVGQAPIATDWIQRYIRTNLTFNFKNDKMRGG